MSWIAQRKRANADQALEGDGSNPSLAQLDMKATYSYQLLVIIVAGRTAPSITNRAAPQTRARVEFIGFT